MFKKVLIANRGEIAVRVQQTLHAMGIATVAVYSDPDAASPHVMIADDAYPLRGNTAEETYLDTGKLIEIARKSGAQAVHPGYGFLSENAGFARACQDAGLAFIGPNPESMELMGDKVRSKDAARRAGVPIIPSSPVYDGDDKSVALFARETGFPLMVKAAAGGGGRGMRVVSEAGQLRDSLEAASREAQAAFGDGRVFLERYIEQPHHIEIQVLADSHGGVIHLFERDCSIQRRHQKVIEETPSPIMTPELRERMGNAAVALTKESGYVNAGTVEFLVDAHCEFYFLEMNTRLQVEHPITETITGIDLVEQQVRIANCEPLGLGQDDVKSTGHAIECRIYAENPYDGFIPSTGTLRLWQPPSGPGIRLDSGFVEGQEVSSYYDPLLAKLVTWGADRTANLRRMEEALRRFIALGVVTNIPFLRDVISHPNFRDGKYDTRFIEEHPELLQPADSGKLRNVAQALASQSTGRVTPASSESRNRETAGDSRSPWRLAGPWRNR